MSKFSRKMICSVSVLVMLLAGCYTDFGGTSDIEGDDSGVLVYDAGQTDTRQAAPDTASDECGHCPSGTVPVIRNGVCRCEDVISDSDAGTGRLDGAQLRPDTNHEPDTAVNPDPTACDPGFARCPDITGNESCYPADWCLTEEQQRDAGVNQPDTADNPYACQMAGYSCEFNAFGYCVCIPVVSSTDAGTSTTHDSGCVNDCGQSFIFLGCSATGYAVCLPIAGDAGTADTDTVLNCPSGTHVAYDILGNRFCAPNSTPSSDAGIPPEQCEDIGENCRPLPGSVRLCICDPVEPKTDAGDQINDCSRFGDDCTMAFVNGVGICLCSTPPPDEQPDAGTTDASNNPCVEGFHPRLINGVIHCYQVGGTTPAECAAGFEPWDTNACALNVPDYSEPAGNPCSDHLGGNTNTNSRICILDRSENGHFNFVPDGRDDTFCVSAEGLIQSQSDADGQGAPYDREGFWATEYIEGDNVPRSYSDLFGHLYAQLPAFVIGYEGQIYDDTPEPWAAAYLDRGYVCKDFSGRSFEGEVTFVSQYSRRLMPLNPIHWSEPCENPMTLMTRVGDDALGICQITPNSSKEEFVWHHNHLICANPRVGTEEEEGCVDTGEGFMFRIKYTEHELTYW